MAKLVALAAACVAVGAGLFALGRESVDTDEARREARAEGLRAGRAAGVAEGRALQAGESRPRGAREAFKRGYTAGANDAFGGFDGGWTLGRPYVITLRRGSGAIAYRIDSRSGRRESNPH